MSGKSIEALARVEVRCFELLVGHPTNICTTVQLTELAFQVIITLLRDHRTDKCVFGCFFFMWEKNTNPTNRLLARSLSLSADCSPTRLVSV